MSSQKRGSERDNDCKVKKKQIKMEEKDDYEESNRTPAEISFDWDVKEEKMFKIEEDDDILFSPPKSKTINKRKGKPVKLEDRPKILETYPHSRPRELFLNFISAKTKLAPPFLTRNVRQKKNIIREREQMIKRWNPDYTFKTKLDGIEHWTGRDEPCNTLTSSYLVESYTVFVFQDDQVTVKDNWISMLTEDKDEDGDRPDCRAMFCDKTIELGNELMKKIKMVFFVVQARKNLYKGEASGGKNKDERELNQANYETVFRYGVKKLYDTDAGISRLGRPIFEVRLVNKDDNPEYLEIFGTEKPSLGWIKNVDHLKLLDKANDVSKYFDGFEGPHLIMLNKLIESSENDEDEESDEQRRVFSNGAKILSVHDCLCCPIRSNPYPTEKSFDTDFKLRYPCFRTIPSDVESNDEKYWVVTNPNYFSENVIRPFDNFCDFRHPNHRGVKCWEILKTHQNLYEFRRNGFRKRV